MDAIVMLLRKMKLPFAYDHFAEGKGPDPPFVIYRCSGTDNFPADDRVYFPVEDIVIELYTDKKEPTTEKKLEKLLTDAGIFYEKFETYIASEKLYEVTYSFEQGKN